MRVNGKELILKLVSPNARSVIQSHPHPPSVIPSLSFLHHLVCFWIPHIVQ